MHEFPLIDALWASVDKEKPSGDDPKRVALALARFYRDLRGHLDENRALRWQTPLFQKNDPVISSNLDELIPLCDELGTLLPQADPGLLEELRKLDHSLRTAIFSLEEEEKTWGLPRHASPKLNQFQYLFEGWKRNYLSLDPFESFLQDYLGSVDATLAEIKMAETRENPHESDEEKEAIERAVATVTQLQHNLTELTNNLYSGAAACAPFAERILATGQALGQVFETLERCSPLEDPCPFCGGQISLSGRCRKCSRRLPHLDESQPATQEIQSDFISVNCRAVDLALTRWELEPEDFDLWHEFQVSVREFANHVNKGRQALDMLAMAPDRPIDSASSQAQREETLKSVAVAFQDALTILSRFSQPSEPPLHPLDPAWREPLKEAELKLKELEDAATPENV